MEARRPTLRKQCYEWCARPGRWLDREPEVLENGAAGFARGEDGEDAHAAATGVANQDIDGEHALEQVGPGEPTPRGLDRVDRQRQRAR